MRLPKAVLDVVRGAGGAAVALAIGCSSSGGGIHQEPAAQLRPVVPVAPVAVRPPVAAPTVPVVATPTQPATLDPLPPSPAVADAGAAPVATGTRPRRHHVRDPLQQPSASDPLGLQVGIGGIGGRDVHAGCGRG